MSATKPSLPKGTRDFSPEVMVKRNFILNTIRSVFEKFGYLPLETPSMENLSVLTGKYGEEGDQLLFRVLNSGDFLNKTSEEDYRSGSKSMASKISNKGLRYDLTVPLARYVVMHQNDITFPFKRYQIQPVWRADRPQKGRYREFYQCDADVLGTPSLICEAEIIVMIHEVMTGLGIENFTIKLNHRKVLSGITDAIEAQGKEADFAVAIDKLEKIGKEKVWEELSQRGFSAQSLKLLEPLLNIAGKDETALTQLDAFLKSGADPNQGTADLREILTLVSALGLGQPQIKIDPTLARGLSYYTGTILEVTLGGVSIGSVSGGGRYDELTTAFGLPGISGVGFSFGLDRLYDAIEEMQLFPKEQLITTQAMIAQADPLARAYGLKILTELRRANIPAEIYPDAGKLKKQMAYAHKKQIPWVAILGSEEMEQEKVTLKNMASGEQASCTPEQAIDLILGKTQTH